ncbi:receptor-type tyrosine-protein phosphatase H-like isoform X2 [Trachinotus anak]
MATNATEAKTTSTPSTIPMTTRSCSEANDFKSVGQNETSITLQWKKVDNILNYTLKFDEEERNVTAPMEAEQVTCTITGLTNGTEYNFTLYTVCEDITSTGVNLTAFTVPGDVQDVKVLNQTESSIALMWDKVNDIPTYILQYNSNGGIIEIDINASHQVTVEHVVSPLISGTIYNFTIITEFGNLNSSGYTFKAVTAPRNADDFKSVGQNETSITLEWKKVDNILSYKLKFSEGEIKVTAPAGDGPVTHTITGLTNGTEYIFTLYTVFEDITSTGVNLTAFTAPRNADDFKSVGQNETSITLEWKKVGDNFNYTLKFSEGETNVTASAGDGRVTHTITGLTNGKEYNFTLYTVFEDIRSTGVNLTAFTAPRNADDFKSVGQNETSITLQWEKVDDIHNYTLKFSEEERNVTASAGDGRVTHTITGLTNGTEYIFTLYTVFEDITSTGVNLTAFTVPGDVQDVKVLNQTESSIALMWDKVNDIPTYILQYNSNGGIIEKDINASHQVTVEHMVSPLISGTIYNFTIITVFRKLNSSGYTFKAVTAPRNADDFKSVGQNETSITLQWKKVDNILSYKLKFSEGEIKVTAPAKDEQVTHTIKDLQSGTRYYFSLFAVFENVSSSGVNHNAVTAPENVKNVSVVNQTVSSITFMWDKVGNISTYNLSFNNDGHVKEQSSATYQEESVKYEVSSLTAGKKYSFTVITVFEGVNSTGYTFEAATVPPVVSLVNVTERSVTSITLKWEKLDKDWSYLLEINGSKKIIEDENVVSYSVTSLKPGTKYPFSVITTFSELSSTVYEGFTVTAIDCTSVTWHVTNSSIQGMVEGLFSNATASYEKTHVSHGGSNVSFTGLYPGATYELVLVYEHHFIAFEQCRHNITVLPPILSADCEYWDSGYSVIIVWNKPEGFWTEVEVNVIGQTHKVPGNAERKLKLSGFQPAKKYEVSLSSLSGTVRSYEPFVFMCSTDPRGVIAGSVVAVLLFVVLVCLAVFILFKRPDLIRKKPFIGGSKLSDKKKCKAISVAKFPDHFCQLSMDDNRGFSQEYENLVPVGTEQTRRAATVPENKVKNRFSNVLPYDWCRVKLSTSHPNETSDYINASYMPGYNREREYIATQGPLPSTVDDFWRMIWEQGVKGIVMVTNCVEGGRTKCERYWPTDSRPCIYGELLITTRSEQQEPNWTLREFCVKNTSTSEERTVRHFHFTAWPDHGVPQGTDVLIQFRGLVRWHIEKEGDGAPTVVHCSAGVGRTGTIIALDVLLQQLYKKRAVGINAFVHKMRLNRPYMVQTESQYVFLHQCIMDSLQPDEKTEENIYENADMIYVNATALQEFRRQKTNA